MKTIGLIGGTSWVSTAEYYRQINEISNAKLGGAYFAECIMFSLNFGTLRHFAEKQDHENVFVILLNAALRLKAGGADCLALCANTLHKYYDRLQNEIDIPIVHIAEATAAEIRREGQTTVGLLGTKLTMESDFYTAKLKEAGIETIIPGTEKRNYIDNAIFSEFVYDKFYDTTRDQFLEIIDDLHQQGAEGIILGCTEIPLLISKKYSNIPLFDTLNIHSNALVDFALAE